MALPGCALRHRGTQEFFPLCVHTHKELRVRCRASLGDYLRFFFLQFAFPPDLVVSCIDTGDFMAYADFELLLLLGSCLLWMGRVTTRKCDARLRVRFSLFSTPPHLARVSSSSCFGALRSFDRVDVNFGFGDAEP